jgi:RNA polymerase sigma-70 factor (sigma-E family)
MMQESRAAAMATEGDQLDAEAGLSSLARMYAEHSVSAVRFAYLLTGDAELAEDLVQDAFVRLIGRFGGMRRPESFNAYLRRTILNLAYGAFRRRRVERGYLAREGVLAARLASGLPDVEVSDELWFRLQGLAPRQRAALILRYYEDLSEHQTADALGCSVRTVKSLVSRGLAAMRAQQGGDR